MRGILYAIAALAAALTLLASCGDDEAGDTAGGGGAAATGASNPASGPAQELVLLTHDSFDAKEDVIQQFEQEHNAKLTVLKAGDANQVVNRAILNAGNPEADLLFGVDNLTFRRAEDARVFSEHRAKARDDIPAALRAQFKDSASVTPIDFGYVDINYDKQDGGAPPATFEDLTTEAWRGKLVVEDPATSSPGLQFLASTVAYFGDTGARTWRDYWRELKANDVLVTDGWTEAYQTHFSHNGGTRPLVVSYTTSPAAEVFFGSLAEPPTVNVIPGPLFRQVEAAGVLRGAKQPQLAGAFIDFMLSKEFQEQIPETMFVYPALPNTPTPTWWRWAEVPGVRPVALEATQQDVDRWVREWTEIMRR